MFKDIWHRRSRSLVNSIEDVAKHRKTSSGITFLSTQDDIASIRSGDQCVLAGELAGVSTSKSETSPFPGLTAQPDLVLRSGQRLYGWVAPEVLERSIAKSATLMADQLAEYALSQNDDVVIVSGVINESDSVINIVVAEGGRLRSVEERNIGGAQSARLTVDLDNLLDRIASRHSKARFLIASPLPEELAKGKWIHIGERPFRIKRLRAIGGYVGFQFRPLPFVVPGIISIALLAAGAFFIAKPISDFEKARDEFNLTAGSIRGGSDYSPEDLDLNTRRKEFIDHVSKVNGALAKAPIYAVALAQSMPAGSRLLRLSVTVDNTKKTEQQNDRQVIISAQLMIPRDVTIAALDQAAPILNALSASTGQQARMAVNGWREEQTDEGGKKLNWRIYTLETVSSKEQ